MTQEEFSKRYTYDVAVDRIGGGGFGTVYKAYDNVLHRDVAIKVSEVKTTADGKKTFSLKDEFEALSHVPKHPNIANYEEFYSFKMPVGIFDYAVMQYYPDGNLSNAIKEGMTDEQKEEVAMQLLEGIDFLHKHKVVHRDLKPGNILIVKHGGHIIPLITDFGLSKSAETGDGSQFSNSFGGGTQRYSSPEQLQGKPLRFNTDLWSYGAIVYELFMGEQLFSPGSGASNSAQAELEVYNKIIHGDVQNLAKMPERWRKVAERCMVVDPEKRVKSAEELIFLLKGYEEATDVEGVAVSQGQQQPPAQPQQKPQNQPQPVKPAAKPITPKPVNNKPEPPKPETPSGGKKKGKGLWISLGLAVVAFAVVFLLRMKPKEETPVPVDPDTEAFMACQTVDDYRNYIGYFGKNGQHYAEAKHFVDSVVADSTAKAKAEAEKKEKEAFYKCTTIEACEKYLKAYPEGQYVEQVKAKKAELEQKQADELAEAEAKAKLEEEEAIMADLEKVDLAEIKPTNNSNTNSNGSMNSTSSSLTFTANGVSFVMKRVEGGTFQMGSNDSEAYSDEKPVHSVTVSSFYMGETEVSQALWKAVMGTTVRQQRDKADTSWPLRGEGDNYPMYYVNWKECQDFIRELNRLTGKNFRLPTEAEWEYAARGGNKGNGCKYAGSDDISSVAWYTDNSGGNTHPVKGKSKNELGLYDMSGNVWEWCSDMYDDYGNSGQTNPNPQKTSKSYSYRVLRGGSWYNYARYCRVSSRGYYDPDYRGDSRGFRLVLP